MAKKNIPMSEKLSYSVSEASLATGVSKGTLWKCIKLGTLKATRPPTVTYDGDGKAVRAEGSYLILKADLERFIRGQAA